MWLIFKEHAISIRSLLFTLMRCKQFAYKNSSQLFHFYYIFIVFMLHIVPSVRFCFWSSWSRAPRCVCCRADPSTAGSLASSRRHPPIHHRRYGDHHRHHPPVRIKPQMTPIQPTHSPHRGRGSFGNDKQRSLLLRSYSADSVMIFNELCKAYFGSDIICYYICGWILPPHSFDSRYILRYGKICRVFARNL